CLYLRFENHISPLFKVMLWRVIPTMPALCEHLTSKFKHGGEMSIITIQFIRGELRMFLILIIASIRKPAIPLLIHQLTLLKSSLFTFGFSQLKSGCSLAKACK